METIQMIASRRAIRRYTGQITTDQRQQLIQAAQAAPVGRGNYDNYQLTVIQKPEVLRRLTGIYAAPTVFIVSSLSTSAGKLVSAGMIAHNIELAAEDLGLGANYNMECLLNLPQGLVPKGATPLIAVTVGQTDEKFAPRDLPSDRIKTNLID